MRSETTHTSTKAPFEVSGGCQVVGLALADTWPDDFRSGFRSGSGPMETVWCVSGAALDGYTEPNSNVMVSLCEVGKLHNPL